MVFYPSIHPSMWFEVTPLWKISTEIDCTVKKKSWLCTVTWWCMHHKKWLCRCHPERSWICFHIWLVEGPKFRINILQCMQSKAPTSGISFIFVQTGLELIEISAEIVLFKFITEDSHSGQLLQQTLVLVSNNLRLDFNWNYFTV